MLLSCRGRRRSGLALIALLVLIVALVRVPLANAGSPDEPAPPTAIM